MTPRYVVLEKAIGQTPLEAIQAWKAREGIEASVKASYAGRLDPMASGKLLVLLGEECKRQGQYIGLDKEYEVEVLFGVGSDTGDVLGLVTPGPEEVNHELLAKTLKGERGTHLRQYPSFSSKTVDGIPLFLHSLSDTEVEIPKHPETIYQIELCSVTSIERAALQSRIESLLAKTPMSTDPRKVLGADFRIEAVRESWNTYFTHAPQSTVIARIRVTAGSGTYMRSLATRLGEATGSSALALSIHRTRIGRYRSLPFGYGAWTRQYK